LLLLLLPLLLMRMAVVNMKRSKLSMSNTFIAKMKPKPAKALSGSCESELHHAFPEETISQGDAVRPSPLMAYILVCTITACLLAPSPRVLERPEGGMMNHVIHVVFLWLNHKQIQHQQTWHQEQTISFVNLGKFAWLLGTSWIIPAIFLQRQPAKSACPIPGRLMP
jgi:hypothetical protein